MPEIRESFLPVAIPWIGEEEKHSVIETLESGWLTTGPKTKLFEQRFAEWVGAEHAVGVNSCTAGLHLILCALGVGPGDEVIISDLTFACNANIIVQLKAEPVIVDIDPVTQLIDLNEIEKEITSRTKAIIPVHYAGLPAPMNEIHALAAHHGIAVVEDAAHASGTRYHEQLIGALPGTVATAFSFYATKNLATGEGGMVTTNDAELADKIRVLSLHGMSRDAWKRYTSAGSWYYEIVAPGYKYNMTDIQAALGLEQLKKIERFNERRREISARYDEAFGQLPHCIVPPDHAEHYHSRHLYPLLIKPETLTLDRAQVIDELRARNIGSTVHYVPLHMHPYYRDLFSYTPESMPHARWVYERTISLPLFPKMTDEDVDYVIAHLLDIFSRNSR